MENVGQEGRTVFFVSHNMPAITRLCPRTILLDEGKIIQDGPSHQVVSKYLGFGLGKMGVREWPDPSKAPGNDVVRLSAVRIRDSGGNLLVSQDIRRPVGIEVEYWNLKTELRPSVSIHLFNEDGICVFASNDFNNLAWRNQARSIGLVRSTCWIPGNFLAEGHFRALVGIATYNPTVVHALQQDAV